MTALVRSGLALLMLCLGCANGAAPPAAGPAGAADTTASHDDTHENGQQWTFYVPAYSQIFYRNGTRTFPLTVTLSIRNTDTGHPVTLRSVAYHDSGGGLVRNYVDRPVALAPLASTTFTVAEDDLTGGTGASFLVTLSSSEGATEPIVHAIMVSTAGTQGISFLTQGRLMPPR